MFCKDCNIELNSYGVCPKCRRYMLPWKPNPQYKSGVYNQQAYNQINNSSQMINYQQNGFRTAYQNYQQPSQYGGQNQQIISYQQQYPMVVQRNNQMMQLQQRNGYMARSYQYPSIRCSCCNSIIPYNSVVCAYCKNTTEYGERLKNYSDSLFFDHTETIKKAIIHLILGLIFASIFVTANDKDMYWLFIVFPAGWLFIGKHVGHVFFTGNIMFFCIGLVITFGIGAAVGMIVLPLEFIVGIMELVKKRRVLPGL